MHSLQRFLQFFTILCISNIVRAEVELDMNTLFSCKRNSGGRQGIFPDQIKNCLGEIFPTEAVQTCLVEFGPSDEKSVESAGLKCIPGLPDEFRKAILDRRITADTMRNAEMSLNLKHKELTPDQVKVIENFVDLGEILMDGTMKLEDLSKDTGVPMDFFEVLRDFITAAKNDKRIFFKGLKYKETLPTGPERDAVTRYNLLKLFFDL